ncbi:hypothetical protein ABK040_015175 [Willaertia magna]
MFKPKQFLKSILVSFPKFAQINKRYYTPSLYKGSRIKPFDSFLCSLFEKEKQSVFTKDQLEALRLANFDEKAFNYAVGILHNKKSLHVVAEKIVGFCYPQPIHIRLAHEIANWIEDKMYSPSIYAKYYRNISTRINLGHNNHLIFSEVQKSMKACGLESRVNSFYKLFKNILISKLSNLTDSSLYNIPFIAGSPGSGKTRTGLEVMGMVDKIIEQDETFNNKDLVIEIMNNRVEIYITFGNGTKLIRNKDFDPIIALNKRILSSYFNISEEFLLDLTLNNLGLVLDIIVADRNISNPTKNPLLIYLMIDEFSLIDNPNIPDLHEKPWLDSIVNAIEHEMIGHTGTILVPLFAGTSYGLFTNILRQSTHSIHVISLYLLSKNDVYNIVNSFFEFKGNIEQKNKWSNNPQFCKYLGLIGGHPRLLQFYLEFFEGDASKAYTQAVNKIMLTVNFQFESTSDAAKIFALAITNTNVAEYDPNFMKCIESYESLGFYLVIRETASEWFIRAPACYLHYYANRSTISQFMHFTKFMLNTEDVYCGKNLQKFNTFFDLAFNRASEVLGIKYISFTTRHRIFKYIKSIF